MLNYKEIIDELDIEKIKQLLEKLDVPYEETENYLLMPTACHNEDLSDASWKLYYYKNNKIFYCYTECSGMSIFKFLEHYYDARQIDYDWYNDVYLVAQDCSNFSNDLEVVNKYKAVRENYKKREVPVLPTYSAAVLDMFVKRYPVEWLRDNISRQAMDKFGILYSISQNKIIIPHYDVEGRLVGIRGRALNPWEIENFAKYAPVKIEQTVYKHPLSMNLYGLYQNKENIIKSGIVYVFEGEKSVLISEGFKQPNCSVACCGSNLNIFQVKLLLKECHPREIVVCFDNEELPKQEEYFDKLYRICKKYSKYTNFSFIYDRENLTNYKDAPVDKGEWVFNQLVARRVKVH
jgi:hypothetical protein